MPRVAPAIFLVAIAALAAAQPVQYVPSIEGRLDISDLVCTGKASAPLRTGLTRVINGEDRDQLSSEVTIEDCFKGQVPASGVIQVLGYSEYSEAKLQGAGFAYAGPPVGFLRAGRNLLFLRRTSNPEVWDIAVPVYETAIRLADQRPSYPHDSSPSAVRVAMAKELEAGLAQFDATDVSDIGRMFDVLGTTDAVAELKRFSSNATVAVQRDIAAELLRHEEQDREAAVISLLMDATAPSWKRANAAGVLGEHGTADSVPYLKRVAEEPANTDQQFALRRWAEDALHRLGAGPPHFPPR